MTGTSSGVGSSFEHSTINLFNLSILKARQRKQRRDDDNEEEEGGRRGMKMNEWLPSVVSYYMLQASSMSIWRPLHSSFCMSFCMCVLFCSCITGPMCALFF